MKMKNEKRRNRIVRMRGCKAKNTRRSPNDPTTLGATKEETKHYGDLGEGKGHKRGIIEIGERRKMEIRKTTDNEDFSFFSSSCNLHIFQSLYLPLIHSLPFLTSRFSLSDLHFTTPFRPQIVPKYSTLQLWCHSMKIVRCFVR